MTAPDGAVGGERAVAEQREKALAILRAEFPEPWLVALWGGGEHVFVMATIHTPAADFSLRLNYAMPPKAAARALIAAWKEATASAVAAARAQEREACAVACERSAPHVFARDIAAAIRSRDA